MSRLARQAAGLLLAALTGCGPAAAPPPKRPPSGAAASTRPVQARSAGPDTTGAAAAVPDSPDEPALLFRKARVLYDSSRHEEAVPIFGRIALKKSQVSVHAANLLLDSLNILRRHRELLEWVDRFLKTPHLTADQDLRRTLLAVRRAGARLEVEDLERQGKYAECGDGYLRLASGTPADPRADELLYNAAICYDQAALGAKARAARRLLIKNHPGSPLAARARAALGAPP